MATPASIINWEAASISAACSKVATGTVNTTTTSTLTITTSVTSTQTQHVTATVTTIAPASSCASDVPNNLLTNGFFDNSGDPWYTWVQSLDPASLWELAPSDDMGGSCGKALHIISSQAKDPNTFLGLVPPQTVAVAQDIALVVGTRYRVTFRVKRPVWTAGHEIQTANTYVAMFTLDDKQDMSKWSDVEFTFTATVARDTFIVAAVNSSEGEEEVFIDNIEVVPDTGGDAGFIN
jgi:hypothetical protein